MATKKKGFVRLSGEWARHLRPYLSRRFWKQHRKAERKLIRNER